MKKILVLVSVVVIFLLAMSSASAILGVGDEDLIDVVSIGIYDDYSGGSFGGAVDASISQREFEAETNTPSISDITGEELQNDTYDYDIDLGIIFEISPKDTIKDVKDIKFDNIEVTYKDESVQKVEPFAYHNGVGDLEKDKNYSLPVPYTLDQKLWNESIPLKDFYGSAHVKADMIINSSTETNKVVGHIDDDVTHSG